MIEARDLNHNTGPGDYFQKGASLLNQTARGKLQSRRSKLNDDIIKELRIRDGAENLLRATNNKKVKETVAVELDFINSTLQLLKEELSDLNSKVDEYEHDNCTSAIPMISLGLKETKDILFKKPLQDILVEHYHEEPSKCDELLVVLDAMRQAVRTPVRTDGGIELLCKYYNHLGNVDKRFYGGMQPVTVYFQWCDALTGSSIVQRTIGFERGSILFNIGALCTQIGTKQDRTSTAGLDLTIGYYQRSAGIFRCLRERFSNAPTKDMQHDVLTMLELLMLSQAQECIYDKAALQLEAGKPTLADYLAVAQESSTVSEMYEQTRNSMYSRTAKDALPLSWVTMAMVKTNHYKALSHFYAAKGLLVDDGLTDVASLRSLFEKVHAKSQETRLQEDYVTDPKDRPMLSKAHLKEALLLHDGAVRDASFCRHTVKMSRFQEIIKHARDRSQEALGTLEEEENYLDVFLSAPRIKPLSAQCASPTLPDFASYAVEDLFKELGPVAHFNGRRRWTKPRTVVLRRADRQDGYGLTLAGGQPVIVDVVDSAGPAATQGVLSSDVIVAVNNVDVKWKTKEEVAELVLQSDTSVLLTIVTMAAEEQIYPVEKAADALTVSSSDDGMHHAPGSTTSSWRRKKTGDSNSFLRSKTVKK